MSGARMTVWPFFALLFLLSLPFWILGAAVGKLDLPINLPVAALMAFVPMVVALVLTARESGPGAALALLRRVADIGRVRWWGWFVVAAALMPVALVVAHVALRLAGAALPSPVIPFSALPVFFAMFVASAIGEELGWQGYVFPRLAARSGALSAALMIGAVWAIWHLVPFLQAERAANGSSGRA